MAVFNVTYLGAAEGLHVPLRVDLAVRRWPVELGARKARSVPKNWSAEQRALAEYNAEAVRFVVALARELRAGRPRVRRSSGEISLVCSAERVEMLLRMFATIPSEPKIIVDGKIVTVAVRDRNAVEMWRHSAGRNSPVSSIVDEYDVRVDSDQLVFRVAPRVLSAGEAELYGALRDEGISIDEALELVDTLGRDQTRVEAATAADVASMEPAVRSAQ
jgi:hypothetical protein